MLIYHVQSAVSVISKLRIRWDLKIIRRQFFLFLNITMYCDPSLEPSGQDDLSSGHNYVFVQKYGKLSLNYLCCSFFSGPLLFPFLTFQVLP